MACSDLCCGQLTSLHLFFPHCCRRWLFKSVRRLRHSSVLVVVGQQDIWVRSQPSAPLLQRVAHSRASRRVHFGHLSQPEPAFHFRRRPYRVECTGSLPTSEVKRRRARLVLGWGTAREVLRVLTAFASRRVVFCIPPEMSLGCSLLLHAGELLLARPGIPQSRSPSVSAPQHRCY